MRPCREQREELAAFQLIELHSIPARERLNKGLAMAKWSRNFVSQRQGGRLGGVLGVFDCLCDVLAQCGHSTPRGSAADDDVL